MHFFLVLLVLSSLLPAQTPWELRRWNDIRPDTGPNVKPLDYTRGATTIVPSANGGFFYGEMFDNQIREYFPDGRVERRFGNSYRGGEIVQEALRSQSGLGRYFCFDGTGALWTTGAKGIYRSNASGQLTLIAENLEGATGQDPATLVPINPRPLSQSLFQVEGLACGANASVYFSEARTNSIVELTPDGIGRRIAGTGPVSTDAGALASATPALQYAFAFPTSMVRWQNSLFIYDSRRVHRLDLDSSRITSLIQFQSALWDSPYPYLFGLVIDGDRLLVGEPEFKVGQIPLTTSTTLRVTDHLPSTAFDLSINRIEAQSFARLADGSVVLGATNPPNIYRSLNNSWVPILGTKVKEERVPLSLAFFSYFEDARWSSDGEFLFTISLSQGDLATAGYRQGDNFLTVYSHSGPRQDYFSGFAWGNFASRNAAGDWISGNHALGEMFLWRAATGVSTTLRPPLPPGHEFYSFASFLDNNTLLFRSAAALFRYRLDTGGLETLTRTGPDIPNIEGPLLQTNISGGEVFYDPTGYLSFYDAAERSTGFRFWRADIMNRSLSRLTGDAGSPMGADGMVARNSLVFAFKPQTCGNAGALFADHTMDGLRFIDRQGILRDILKNAGNSSSEFLGDPLRNGFRPWSYMCWPDGSVVASSLIDRVIRDIHPPNYLRLSKHEGDEQVIYKTGALPTALSVRVTRNGQPVANSVVRFRLFRGLGELSQLQASTDAQGVARTSLRLTGQPGPVWVQASLETGATVMFRAYLRYPSLALPLFSSGSVVGAALSNPPVNRLSSSAIATVFGENLALQSRVLQSSDIMLGELPRVLGGVCLEVNGLRAPLFAVFPSQINFQVPAIPTASPASLRVVVNCGEDTPTFSSVVQVPSASATPEFFYASYDAAGRSPVIAVDAFTGALAPIRPGQWITLYATGLGPVSPPLTPGRVAGSIASLTLPFSIEINGAALPASRIGYAGVAPGTAGQYQINLQLPESLPAGDLPIRIQVGSAFSPSGPYLRIASGSETPAID